MSGALEQQALAFVNQVTKSNATSADDLKSGVLLCNLVNEVSFRLNGSRPITAISKSQVKFAQMENVATATDTMRRDLKMQDRDLFPTGDLFNGNMKPVYHCLTVLEKMYNSANQRAGESTIVSTPTAAASTAPSASAPLRPAPATPAPTAPTGQAPLRAAPVAPTRAAPIAPPTPRSSVVAPLTPRLDEEKKISEALNQLDTQRQRWQKEREGMESKLAEQEKLLNEAKQREEDKQKLLNAKENIESKLQQQFQQQLSEMQADLTNKLAQKTLEIEKIRSSRDLELKNAQLNSSKQVESLTLKLAEYENLSSLQKNDKKDDDVQKQKETEEKYQNQILQIRLQLTKEKEEALLQSKLQQDRERMESEQRAIEAFRLQSEEQISLLKQRAQQDLEKELFNAKNAYEEELIARGGRQAQEQESLSRQRSASLALTIEQEVSQRQSQIEATLKKQFEDDLATMKQGIELRMKSEEAAFKQKEQKLEAELALTSTKLTQERDQYKDTLAQMESQGGNQSAAQLAQILSLKKSLEEKEGEIRLNSALKAERDQFKSQQEEITKAKSTMEQRLQADMGKLEQRLQDETTKLAELQFMLELKTKENEQLLSQKKDSSKDEAEIKQIKLDMELEMKRLSNEMEQSEKKYKFEQEKEIKKNIQIQSDLEKLQKELENERQSKIELQKQVKLSEQQIKSLELVSKSAAAAAAGNTTPVSPTGPSEREQVLEAELSNLKSTHQREVDALNREIDSLKRQLTEAKSAAAAASSSSSGSAGASSAPPMQRPVNPMAAALKASVAEAPATAGVSDSGTPITQRPPNPMAAAFKAGGGASMALQPAAEGGAPPSRPAGGLLAGIQGGIKLKKTTPGDAPGAAKPAASAPAARPPGPLSMVDQLKGGIQLKKTEPRAAPAPKQEDNSSMASIAAQMARDRAARQAAGTLKVSETPAPKK